MPKNSDNNFNVDSLLSGLFPREELNDLFEKRIKELEITPTNALEILDIEYRALPPLSPPKRPNSTAAGFLPSF